ncbi:MAG: hypothetical protein JRG82_18440 [Deltaproteobacteria bacterium]|nr:hypothetical protein [Deltaproteobacteria bacterium]
MRISATCLGLLLVACATPHHSGIMAGHWTPKDGSPERVPLSWETGSEGGGRIHATLGKGGEHFHGKYVRVQQGPPHAEVETVYREWHAPAYATLDWGEEGNYGPNEGVDIHGFVRQYSGKVLATLFGDREHSMRCRFTLSDPQAGLVGGGVGACQVSDGGRLDVEF